MATHRRSHSRFCCLAGLLLVGLPPRLSAQPPDQYDARDLVGVGIVDKGKAIVLATPGLSHRGRTWRFRSFDTSDIAQPIHDVALAAGGTKLFVQHGASRDAILDLSRQHRHNVPLQYVAAQDLVTDGNGHPHSHRLAGQQFVSIRDGSAFVIDDAGAVQPDYPIVAALRAAIAEDGSVLYVRADGSMLMCAEAKSNRSACRRLQRSIDVPAIAVTSRSIPLREGAGGPRFMVLTDHQQGAGLTDPERDDAPRMPVRRAEAALRACLMVNGLAMSDAAITSLANTLVRESADTWAAGGQPVADWRFFRVAADEELYAPVLEFARLETVFPAPFDILEEIAGPKTAIGHQPAVDRLYDRYLRLEPGLRQRQCTVYYRTHSTQGSWIIEYWLYYPFDVGGFGSHPHDPEHIFVEVDKLGGAPRRIIGAGHGYFAGNNVYTADRRGARALGLPLFAIVELGKHASAPDVDRDGAFTPGLDENEYRERAKIWGVRDVIGTINNQLLAYDNTMSITRRPEHALALVSADQLFAGGLDSAIRTTCRLSPMPEGEARPKRSLVRVSDWVILPPCHDLTSECARRFVTNHPDYADLRAIFKEWAFPNSFLRATYGMGPRRGTHSIGLGYAMDLEHVPAVGRVLPLPGRLGVDAFYWHQDVADTKDLDACIGGVREDADQCQLAAGVGWAIRYEQFLSNLFGIFSDVRVYSPPLGDAWIAFGPFVETPLGRRSNVSVQGALSFTPSGEPRFVLRVSAGVWKPKTNHVGVRAGTDHRD